ncbi:Aldehyde dehydrogenase [Leucoagaricus sp. SymC.cos]|nr:Aldehyde dehydrogenase [Leucoagaricus sp. SymC.cos]
MVILGQACIASSCIYVQKGIHNKFLEEISKCAKTIVKATSGLFDKGTLHGPQVLQTQYDHIIGYINSRKLERAKICTSKERHSEKGYFIKPTVFVDAKPSIKIMWEEIFSPVCSVVKFKTEKEVIEWANDTTYSLATNILTENSAHAIYIVNALEASNVTVNCTFSTDVSMPFSRYKQSGIGREFGQEALDIYTQVKAVHINIGQVL